MRVLLPILVCLLAGCAGPVPLGPLVAAEGASVIVFGRGIVDIGVSAISGRNCSIVRLDRRLTYCEPIGPPPPERVCTRTLGSVDCWADASLRPPGVVIGDTPGPTSVQQRYQAARWPKSLAIE